MQENFHKNIKEGISAERLDAYCRDGAEECTTFARYLWNMAVCESLYSPLQMGEIALRNRVFHHERIIHWKDLKQQHEQLLGAIKWISDDLYELALVLDRFTPIYDAGIQPWKEKIRSHWPRTEER